ncbi:hypothetical protein MRX96_055683 [Rhipicephalus microplus]
MAGGRKGRCGGDCVPNRTRPGACMGKRGVTQGSMCGAAPRPGQDAETAVAWTVLEDVCIVLESIALSDYINADTNVIVYEELSAAEILESSRVATTTANSSDDDAVEHGVLTVLTPVTASQVMDSLDILHRFLGAHHDDVTVQLLTECEQRILPMLVPKCQQSKMNDFLKLWK